jgi:hypothetical protein
LLDENGNIIATTTTDENGEYLFDSLTAGTYEVQFIAPDGSDFTTPNTTDDADDSDAAEDGKTGPVVIDTSLPEGNPGRDNRDVDAGIITECVKPVLTAGDVECSGTAYAVNFISSSTNVTASAGTVSGNKVVGIPLGTNVTITANEGVNCVSIITITGPTTCPATCTLPQLSAGQPLCEGTTYSVSFTTDKGTVTTTAGTISGNTITGIPLGTSVTVTATDGECISEVSVSSPSNCNGSICENPRITLSAPVCADDTYSVNFILDALASISTTSGIIGDGVITDIPSGTFIMITVSYPDCSDKMVGVSPPICRSPEFDLAIRKD